MQRFSPLFIWFVATAIVLVVFGVVVKELEIMAFVLAAGCFGVAAVLVLGGAVSLRKEWWIHYLLALISGGLAFGLLVIVGNVVFGR